MARELFTQRGIGEPAALVWRQIQAEQSKMLPAANMTDKPKPRAEEMLPTVSLVVSVPDVANALTFGSQPTSGRPVGRREPPRGDQLSLF